jgi:hypothetical protein
MYSAAVTLSIVYSQEACGTEEKVGGMGSRVQASRTSWRKICQSLASGGIQLEKVYVLTFFVPPGTIDARARWDILISEKSSTSV